MTLRTQGLILTIGVLVSSIIGGRIVFDASRSTDAPSAVAIIQSGTQGASRTYQQASLANIVDDFRRSPRRRWEVLDPSLSARMVLVHDLDNRAPLLYIRTHDTWPIASLTKLLTAIIVAEDIGENRRVTVSPRAIATLGEAGGLQAGEEYAAGDLARLMLMTSSNDAAEVFQESFESPEAFLALMRAKVEKIGMTSTIITEASGVSGANRGSANDLLMLIEYIAGTHPNILAASRLAEFTIQPLNGLEPRTVRNINPFITQATFLGGKTGTSPESKENFLAVFSTHGRRIAIVILGSANRVNDTNAIFSWLDRAYEW